MKYVFKESGARILTPAPGKYSSNTWVSSHYPNPEIPEGDLHQLVPVNFKWTLELTGSVLNCQFKNVTENWDIYNFNFDLSLLSGAPAQSLWILTDEFMAENYNLVSVVGNPDLEGVHNRNGYGRNNVERRDVENAFGRTITARKFKLFNEDSLLSFFVLADNPTPEDIVVIVIRPQKMVDQLDAAKVTPEQYYSGSISGWSSVSNKEDWADHELVVEGNLTAAQETPIGKIYEDLMSHIHPGQYTIAGDIITVPFTTDDDVDFIYLEQVHGYLPSVKIPVTNKAGSFKILTLGMSSGDPVEVKLGFRYWTNKESFKITLP